MINLIVAAIVGIVVGILARFFYPGAVNMSLLWTMILGIGTGSTVNVLIDMLPGIRERIDRVVSSSKATTALLQEKGFGYVKP